MGETTLKTKFKYCVYSADEQGKENGFCVCQYEIVEGDVPPGVNKSKITATGYFLSQLQSATIILKGSWNNDKKRGMQFSVTECSEIIEQTEYGITEFLASGLITGIGKGLARRIYRKFGEQSLDIMDQDIDRLTEVPGISQKKLEKIRDSYGAVSGVRETVSFLGKYGISPKLSQKVNREHISLTEIKANPYALLAVSGISFPIADRINIGLGLSMHSRERITAGIMHALQMNELRGHVGMERTALINAVSKVLNEVVREGKPVSADEIVWFIAELDKHAVISYKGYVYRAKIYYAECDVAKDIIRLLSHPAPAIDNVEQKLEVWQKKNNVELDEIQKQAVITALSSGFLVITGGPGRGKTTITKAIIDIREQYGHGDTILMAPTGRAARRMSESTGRAASTVNSGLKLGESSEDARSEEELKAEQVLLDEVSMLDIWLTRVLLKTVPDGCNVTFVGDPDQLPSVGAGAVLRDIIASGVVPVIKLEKVYRQAEGSTIVENCEHIRLGETQLTMDEQFSAYQANDGRTAARYMIGLYKQKVAQYGADQVALLSPFHHAKSECSVDSVNNYLQQMLNPAGGGKKEISYKKAVYREGDQIMQVKNQDDFCNGDIGNILSITKNKDDETVISVRFQDGRNHNYSMANLDLLELAYCISYHKSQGSEYKCVIGCLLDEHRSMLKRNLIYTGVSRAKAEFIFVGTPSALKTAIMSTDTERRITLLTEKIIHAAKIAA